MAIAVCPLSVFNLEISAQLAQLGINVITRALFFHLPQLS
jgi:hypothetical protein